MYQSKFKEIEETVHEDISKQIINFSADTHPEKLSFIIGVYRDENGNSYDMPVVRKAERKLADDETLTHGYCHALGDKDFRSATLKLALGGVFFIFFICLLEM